MAEMPDVVTLTTISSDWGNDIRDRTVQRYSSVANRATEHPTPAEGDLSYLTDSSTVWQYNGSAWVELLSGMIDTADITDGAVTQAKLAGTVGLVTAGGDVDNTDVALTGSYVDHAAIAFSLPSGWTTCTIHAWGTAGFSTSSGVVGDARIEIGASNGTGIVGQLASEVDTIACRHQAAASGAVTVAIAVRNSGGTGNVEWSSVQYLAIRTS